MKRSLLVFLAVSIVRYASAQEDVYETIARESCDCLSAKNLTAMSAPEAEMVMRACMLEGAVNNNLKMDYSDQEMMRTMSEKVGAHMAGICPEILGRPGGTLQEDVYESIARESCDCLSAKNLTVMSVPEVEMAMRACMLERAVNNNLKLDYSDQMAMQKFSYKVSAHMADICPELFRRPPGTNVNSADGPSDEMKVTGIIKSVKMRDFVSIKLKDDAGTGHNIIWLRYFPGSDRFTDDPRALAGKRVTVIYLPAVYFSPRDKTYRTAKEIINLSFEGGR